MPSRSKSETKTARQKASSREKPLLRSLDSFIAAVNTARYLFFSRVPQLNFLAAGMIVFCHRVVEWVSGKSSEESVRVVNSPLEKLERFLGSHPLTVKFQSFFSSYGGILKAQKTPIKNFHEVQRAYFTDAKP